MRLIDLLPQLGFIWRRPDKNDVLHTDKRDDSDDVMKTDKIDDVVLRGICLAVGDVGRGIWKDHLWQRDLARLMLFADPSSLRNTTD